jgi:hypothetical protein
VQIYLTQPVPVSLFLPRPCVNFVNILIGDRDSVGFRVIYLRECVVYCSTVRNELKKEMYQRISLITPLIYQKKLSY